MPEIQHGATKAHDSKETHGVTQPSTCLDCSRPTIRRGYCRSHYKRRLNDGSLARMRHRPTTGTCTIARCDGPVRARDLCVSHAFVARRHHLTAIELAAVLDRTTICEACGDTFDDVNVPNVDHDHTTGRVRGALCRSCNLALGHAKDSVDRLRLLIGYLEAAR